MELKPCPLCGAKVKIEGMIDDYWRVRCTGCPLEFGRYWFAKGQKQMLREAWNRRVAEMVESRGGTHMNRYQRQKSKEIKQIMKRDRFGRVSYRVAKKRWILCRRFAKCIPCKKCENKLCEEEPT